MARHGIPDGALSRVRPMRRRRTRVIASGELGFPLVVKADGLAAGKGVVIAADAGGSAIQPYPPRWRSIDSGTQGRASCWRSASAVPRFHFSRFVMAIGRMPLGSAQDHKRIFDDDRGPNTGGMGAFAPSPLVDAPMQDRIMREVVDPVLAGMAHEGTPYRGFLYAGLMLTCDGPRVIEFNVRFGDPEAQVIIPLIDGDLAPRLAAAAAGISSRARPAQRRRKTLAS